jgi:peptidoglycan/xylan/chitin deacetylase (PgdA/CDA1 family)
LTRTRRIVTLIASLAPLLLLTVAGSPSWADYGVNLRRGTDALTRGELAEARSYFTQAVATQPTEPLAHLGLGIVYLHAGSDWAEEARTELASAGALPEALVAAAYLEMAQGRYDVAIQYLDDAIEATDGEARSLAVVQCYASLCGKDAMAAKEYEAIARATPADPALINALNAERLAWLGDWARAKSAASAAVAQLSGRLDVDTGSVRLNTPRATHDGAAALPRWSGASVPAAVAPVIASPADGSTVAGDTTVHVVLPPSLAAQSPVVSVLVDSNLLATTDRAPYRFQWNTSRVPWGQHTLTVQVRSSRGGPSIASAQVTCEVLDAPRAPATDPDELLELRRRLRAFVSAPRMDDTWKLNLEMLVRGSEQVRWNREIPSFNPIAGESVLPSQPTPPMPGPPEAGKRVALYFDDGPHPTITPAILDTLQAHGVKGSFFLVGKQCEKYPDLVRRIHAEGHSLGGHSYSHEYNFANLLYDELRHEVEDCVNLMRHILAEGGVADPQVRYFRCPGGNVTPLSNQVVQRAGLIPLDEGIYNTWGYMDRPPEEIVELTLQSDHRIILLHNGEDKTVFILPQLIEALKARGYRFVTADELTGVR